MNKVNQYQFYQLGSGLRPLRDLKADSKHQDYAITCMIATAALRKFIDESSHVPLTRSRAAAQTLIGRLDEFAIQPTLDGLASLGAADKRNLYDHEAKDIHRALDGFEAVLSNEAQDLEVFSISQTLAYSTTTMIERGENVLPEPIRAAISQFARNELKEATRCLVFDLPTAAGFHLLRAVESTLREYYDMLSKGAKRPKMRNGNDAPMGGYIRELETLGADQEVIETLTQIKRLHRDPHMHPESVFQMSESVILLGVVTSAIWVMFKGSTDGKRKVKNTEDAEGPRDTDPEA